MKSLWVPLSAAIAQQRKVETIANNVANANTNGFKKDDITFKEHLTALSRTPDELDLPQREWTPDDFYHTLGAQHSFVKVDGTYTNFEQGQLSPTNNPLDLAISGPGFFEISTPNGIRYTRKGTFTVDPDGTLVNNLGHQVLSRGQQANFIANDTSSSSAQAQERTIRLGGGQVVINPRGEVFQNGAKVAELSLVEFKDVHSLTKEGNSVFINKDNKNLLPAVIRSKIHQGFLEGSNVNAIAEMSNLIKANRHFQSIQRAIKAFDSISGKAVNGLATN